MKLIEKGLSYNPTNQQWISEYPVIGNLDTLPDNFSLANNLHTNLVRRLQKVNRLEDFDKEFKDAVDRGVFKVMKEKDWMYEGPVNYIAMTEAYKIGVNATTPLRICMNSSLKKNGVCLNDLLAKGPSALNCQMELLIRFRGHPMGMALDIKKFYNSVNSVERDHHLRRVLWTAKPNEKPAVYLTAKVNFGDRPAGCVAGTALAATADMFKEEDEVAAEKIKGDSYVDDIITGGESAEELSKLEISIASICQKGGFALKPSVKTGDKADPLKILGVQWTPESDELSIACKVNVSKKKKGINEEEDLDLDTLLENLPPKLTRRIIWRVAMGNYDPIGLLCPIIIQLKYVMKSLSGDLHDKKDWDTAIDPEVANKFKKAVMKLKEAKDI